MGFEILPICHHCENYVHLVKIWHCQLGIWYTWIVISKQWRGRHGRDRWIYSYLCNQCLSPLKL